MPFQSQSQARGAFSGAFGPSMKAKAGEFAHATPGGVKSLPQHVRPAAHKPHLRKRPAAPSGDEVLGSMLGMMGKS